MVVAITPRQWSGLVETLGVGSAIAGLEAELGLSFATDEGLRYRHRQRLWPIFEAAFAGKSLDELATLLEARGVTWSPYRSVHEAVLSQDRFGFGTAAMLSITQPSGYSYPAPGAAAHFTGVSRRAVTPAPRLGEHTDEILSAMLALPDAEIAILHDRGIVS